MSAAPRTSNIAELYRPQFEQFGIELVDDGPVFTGEVTTGDADGSAWVLPLSPTCLVMEHSVVPHHDMMLMERAPEPYACVTQISSASVECMPESGITPANVRPLRGPWPADLVCSFTKTSCRAEYSPLRAGEMYHSRCILFLPEYFDELERRWPGDFRGLFDAFALPWCEEAQAAIGSALRRLTDRRARAHAATLYATGVVDAMVADLAAAHVEGSLALAEAGSLGSRRLAEEAAAEVERAFAAGRAIGVDELAARLYVSRSKLCATFKQETGETVGAYVRRRRAERAEDLLAKPELTAADVAARLGYPTAAAFSQAFKAATGFSPREWRERR